MKRFEYNQEESILHLINKYEQLNESGRSYFYEVTEYLDIASYYLEDESNFSKAADVIHNALSQHPFASDLFVKLAEIYFLKKHFTKAKENILKAATFSPNDTEIELFHAEILISLSNFRGALDILNEEKFKHLSDSKQTAEVYYLKALISESLNEYHQMYNWLKKALSIDSKHSFALDKFWIAMEMKQKHKDAIHFLESLIDESPYNYRLWYNLGHAFLGCNSFSKASVAFEYTYLIKKDFKSGYTDRAFALIENKKYKEALSCYEEFEEVFETNDEILVNKGICYLKLEDLDQAKPCFYKALIHNPKDHYAYFQLAKCDFEGQNYQSVVSLLHKAIEINDSNENYFAMQAEAYFQMDNFSLAADAFQKAIDTAPETPVLWIQYISFLLDIGELSEAQIVFDDSTSYCNGAELLYVQFCILHEQGSFKEAKNQLILALTENKDIAPIIFEICPHLSSNDNLIEIIADF